jgi:hypothetical protein
VFNYDRDRDQEESRAYGQIERGGGEKGTTREKAGERAREKAKEKVQMEQWEEERRGRGQVETLAMT